MRAGFDAPRFAALGRLAGAAFRVDEARAAFFLPPRVAAAAFRVRAGLLGAARRVLFFLPDARFLAAEAVRRPAGRAVRVVVARLRAAEVDFRTGRFLAIGIGPRSGLATAVDRESVSDVSSSAYRKSKRFILQPAGAEIPASTIERGPVTHAH